MKKILCMLLVLVFMVEAAYAARVGVVVELINGEVIEECIIVESGEKAYHALKKLDLDSDKFEIDWLGIYPLVFLKSVNGIGYNEYKDGRNWAFSTVEPGKNSFDIPPEKTPGYGYAWGDYPIGVEGQIIGLNYATTTFGNASSFPVESIDPLPPYKPYSELCPLMFIANITKIYVDGSKQSDSKTRRGKITDVFPESTVEFKIELENLYDSDTDIEIKDISIEGAIEEIDDGDDIEEDISEFDLDADRETSKELEFKIPLEVDAKDRLVTIEIEAEDDAGIRYEKEITFDLEVEKEKHDIRILKAELDRSSYGCEENALLSLSMLNIGSEEEKVSVQAYNEELEIDIRKSFELSNDAYEDSSRYEKKLNLWIPGNIDKKVYPISINVDYGGETEDVYVDLEVNECQKKEADNPDEDNDENMEGASKQDIEVQAGGIIPSEDGGMDSEKNPAPDGPEEEAELEVKSRKGIVLALTVVLGLLVFTAIALFGAFVLKAGKKRD
ncbi:hypothetical protein KY358_02035 [Candidatus Woesearchaeota archaeon]|nr:hypothetical protein [Candidatus Woesearchaeota archaeon]